MLKHKVLEPSHCARTQEVGEDILEEGLGRAHDRGPGWQVFIKPVRKYSKLNNSVISGNSV